MIYAHVDFGVDVAAPVALALTAGFALDTPTTCRTSPGGSS
jgi:hypothetical protein